MELVSGFLLWLAEVFGIKFIREEKNKFKLTIKVITLLIVGIMLVMLFFVVWYY
jgi:hypothetical protein